jgi:hypothetical protein
MQEIDLEDLAAFYRVNTRTIRRWHALGVDLHDPVAVAEALAAMKNPSRNALHAILAELTEDPSCTYSHE